MGAIHPWPKNPRKITERAVTKVAGLIKQFGFSNPILVRLANGEIIGGHTRYRAALKLGMASVPVRYMDLSEEDAHALAIADNRSGEETEWDDTLLAAQIRDMRKGGREIASLAFDDEEIDAILKRAGEADPESEADTTLPRDPITEGAKPSDAGEEEGLDIGADKMTQQPHGSESFKFREFTIPIGLETGDRLKDAINRFAEERGMISGFVEHVLDAIDAVDG